MANSDMKMFAEMKTCIIKELIVKLDKENLMNDDLTEFFLNEIKHNKMIKLIANKTEKKTRQNVTMQKEKKEKRPPTEHQSRVSDCMVYLKEKFPEVKHTVRMGTANYMATYLKENDCLVVDIHKPVFEKAFLSAITKMNNKQKEEIFTVPSSSSCNKSVDTEENKEAVKKENKKKKEEKKEESDEEDDREEEVEDVEEVEKKEESDEEESDEEVEEESDEEEEEDMTDLAEESDDE